MAVAQSVWFACDLTATDFVCLFVLFLLWTESCKESVRNSASSRCVRDSYLISHQSQFRHARHKYVHVTYHSEVQNPLGMTAQLPDPQMHCIITEICIGEGTDTYRTTCTMKNCWSTRLWY
jgi:hypothetical protein